MNGHAATPRANSGADSVARRRPRGPGLAPALTLLVLIGPVAAGLVGTALPAFGYLPALGGESASLEPWRALAEAPGIGRSVALSLWTGFAATAISLGIVVLFCAGWHGTRFFTRLQRLLSPLLSLPHVTVAFGLAFLLAPSGWLFRLISPWATGWERPPNFLIINDPAGLSLIAGLVLKEMPFLLLMTLAALGQAEGHERRTVARSLGYGPTAAWLKAVLPAIYPQIRLPVYAVLAFSLSVVDMAIVLGPGLPPPLAIRLMQWFGDPDLSQRFVGSAGAILQLLLVALAIFAWWLGECLLGAIGRAWIRGGRRHVLDLPVRLVSAGLATATVATTLLGLVGMALWSVAGGWYYPAALPVRLSLDTWSRHADSLLLTGINTVMVAGTASLVAVVLVIACLEHEARTGRSAGTRSLWLLYTPLLVPQIAFLFGAQVLLLGAAADGHWLSVAWMHLVFVLPYVFLSLADPWRHWDTRYARTARCLGARPGRVFWRVKLPMLLRPLLIAAAIGFAVSAGLYLPTVFAGAGRVPTLVTEAISVAGGGDRRVIGVYAILQMALPIAVFALALYLPAWLYRHRRGLQITR